MKKFWQIKNLTGTSADIYIYNDIGESWWVESTSANDFKKELDGIGEVQTLNIFINSLGGSVFDGMAIYSQLKRHRAFKNVHVDGIAASIASVIALAGDKITIPKNAYFMIHQPWSIAMGSAEDFRKMAASLDTIEEGILNVYEGHSALTREEIKEMMGAETWMTGEEALEYGFADEVGGEIQIAASVSASEIWSKFRNPPKIAAATALSPPEPRGPGVKNKGRTLSAANEAKIKGARDSLDEVLSQLAEEDDNTQNSLPPPEPPPEPGQRNPKGKQTDNGLLFLCLSQVQVNKNKLRRKANV